MQLQVSELDEAHRYKYRWCGTVGGGSEVGAFDDGAGGRSRRRRSASRGPVTRTRSPHPGEEEAVLGQLQGLDQCAQARTTTSTCCMGDRIYSDTEVGGRHGKQRVAIHGEEEVGASTSSTWDRGRGQRMRGAASTTPLGRPRVHQRLLARENDSRADVGTVGLDDGSCTSAGVRAFRDYEPVTYSAQKGIYRTFRWGKNLRALLPRRALLPQRQAPTTAAPAKTRPCAATPDLAPTAPQPRRNMFAALVPRWRTRPPQGCLGTINDPDRTLLGAAPVAIGS